MPTCNACDSTDEVTRIAVTIDGDPLRLQLDLCKFCRSALLMRVGYAMGEIIRTGQSGTPFPAAAAETPPVSAAAEPPAGAQVPHPNTSGTFPAAPRGCVCNPDEHAATFTRVWVCTHCGARRPGTDPVPPTSGTAPPVRNVMHQADGVSVHMPSAALDDWPIDRVLESAAVYVDALSSFPGNEQVLPFAVALRRRAMNERPPAVTAGNLHDVAAAVCAPTVDGQLPVDAARLAEIARLPGPICGVQGCRCEPTRGHAYCHRHGELLDGFDWNGTAWVRL